jgi:hypothetical protein
MRRELTKLKDDRNKFGFAWRGRNLIWLGLGSLNGTKIMCWKLYFLGLKPYSFS